MKKAQSAMEYLMTYGWAILIVIIVAAALYALGVFNPATYAGSTAVGFTGFVVPAGGWQANSTTVTIILKNQVGARINITDVTATYGGSSSTGTTPSSATLAPNAQQTFFMAISGPTSGSSYSIDIEVTYDNLDSGLTGFKSSGTITGTAS